MLFILFSQNISKLKKKLYLRLLLNTNLTMSC